jgi:hypothetical protein
MASQPGTLEVLAGQLGLALSPLEQRLAQGNVLAFLAELGLNFPQQLLQPGLTGALQASATKAGALPNLIGQLSTAIQNGDSTAILQAGSQLIQQISGLISSLEDIGTKLRNAAGSLQGFNPGEVTAFAEALPSKLLGYMLITYLEQQAPAAIAIGNLFGALDYIRNPASPGDPSHPAFITRQLTLSRLGDLLKSPSAVLATLYDWGAPGFDGTKLIPRLASSLQLLGIPTTIKQSGPPNVLEASLFTLTTTPPGETASLKYAIPAGFDITLPISTIWSARIQAQASLDATLSATITPPANVAFHSAAALDGLFEFDLTAKPDAAHPIVVVGQTGGSRLETTGVSVGAGLTIHWDTTTSSALAEPLVTAQITGGKMVIDTSTSDGFLASVLSGVHVEAGFDLKATWAPDIGLHLEGGAQLQITFPLHLTLGPVTLSTLNLALGVSSDGLPLEISAGLGLTLGFLQISVDRIGMQGLLSFPDHNGNLGPANIALGFKPPNGLGVALDAGVAAGGGFISFDPAKGQYAGILDVELVGVVQVKVIAVLDTILPDGAKGFSFLLIITFQMPPIPLGFGFTLNGVGGLGGVNRTMAVEALRAAQRAHTLDTIMFPADPIANAPAIISNIRSFFPPAQGRYLLGPMLELAWGTPPVITFSIGVILELPDPLRLAILGLIDAGLPTVDNALVELHVDVLGTADFAAKKLAIDGALYNSRVLIYALAGNLALRLTWGSDPNFLFSLGGFNPNFNTAGLDIPPMTRLSVSIGNGDNPRISCNSYFAITSNTLQFGSSTEAYASAGGFSIHGYIGFDVLVIYSPFSFEIDFKATFDVSFEGQHLAGLDVDGTLLGPTPWHLHAHASINILWWSVGASLTLEWGDKTPAILPTRSVLADLVPALNDPRNWSAALPDVGSQAVSLASQKPNATTLRVHPMGTLAVRESIVPLNLTITRYANAAPSDGSLFAISGVQINGQNETTQGVQDYFAAAQFLTLSDDDKLSRPSFERYDAGLNIGTPAIVAGSDSPRTVMYQERYVDTPTGFSRFTRKVALAANVHAALIRQGAGAMSPVQNTGILKYLNGPAVAAITSREPVYVVAQVDDLSVRPDIGSMQGATFFQVTAALNSHLASHPEDAGMLQIIPVHEVLL